jgi:hypothetical protein
MVYQTEAPPVPTRAEEQAMIAKIKESFQSQPYYKYYMNEGVRIAKLEYSEDLKKHKRDKKRNYLRGCIFTAIIAAPLIFWYYSKGPYGTPAHHYPIRYENHMNDGFNGARKFRSYLALTLVVLMGGKMYSHWRTSVRFEADEYMEKATVKLPY